MYWSVLIFPFDTNYYIPTQADIVETEVSHPRFELFGHPSQNCPNSQIFISPGAVINKNNQAQKSNFGNRRTKTSYHHFKLWKKGYSNPNFNLTRKHPLYLIVRNSHGGKLKRSFFCVQSPTVTIGVDGIFLEKTPSKNCHALFISSEFTRVSSCVITLRYLKQVLNHG